MALRRYHLFEFNDSSWAPRALRDIVIESFSRTLLWGHLLAGLVAPFEEFLQRAGVGEVLDVCSGAAGPARILISELRRAGRKPPHFVLTDLQPQVEAWDRARAQFPDEIDYIPRPVDATNIPPDIAGGRARVIINSFHHFPPELAQSILRDAVASSAGVFIAEPWERNPLRFATFIPIGVAALAVNPFLSGRDRLKKALLTFLSPAVVAVAAWDGLVSTVRVYSREELEAMVAPLGDEFVWTWGYHEYSIGGRGYYFYGVPRR